MFENRNDQDGFEVEFAERLRTESDQLRSGFETPEFDLTQKLKLRLDEQSQRAEPPPRIRRRSAARGVRRWMTASLLVATAMIAVAVLRIPRVTERPVAIPIPVSPWSVWKNRMERQRVPLEDHIDLAALAAPRRLKAIDQQQGAHLVDVAIGGLSQLDSGRAQFRSLLKRLAPPSSDEPRSTASDKPVGAKSATARPAAITQLAANVLGRSPTF